MVNEEMCFCKADENIECIRGEKKECYTCPVFLEYNSIIVYCNSKKCLHWKEIPFKYFVNHNKNVNNFEDSAFRGICSRKEIAVRQRDIISKDMYYNINECKSFSNTKISGHMDFSKFPQGGNIG